jgi:putative transposase
MSPSQNHLNHATWECKYHVVFTSKYREKLLFGQIRRHLGNVFRELAQRKECQIEEGHLMPDQPASFDIRDALGRMRYDIESIWHTVRATRRSIEDARDAMERADEVLARRLSGRR